MEPAAQHQHVGDDRGNSRSVVNQQTPLECQRAF